jgi:anti-sigma regulatory factor (Ser/Thr protein kinase)
MKEYLLNLVMLGYKVSFSSDATQLKIEVSKQADPDITRVDTSMLPLYGSHISDQRIKGCLEFQVERLEARIKASRMEG